MVHAMRSTNFVKEASCRKEQRNKFSVFVSQFSTGRAGWCFVYVAADKRKPNVPCILPVPPTSGTRKFLCGILLEAFYAHACRACHGCPWENAFLSVVLLRYSVVCIMSRLPSKVIRVFRWLRVTKTPSAGALGMADGGGVVRKRRFQFRLTSSFEVRGHH